MEEVAKAEGMVLKEDSQDAEFNEGLSLIAEYFQCDIRRILNEMQLFASMTNTLNSSTDVDVFQRGWKAKLDGTKETDIAADMPVILDIQPVSVSRDIHTLITIQGQNFLSTEVATLYMGGEICPHFKVVSDSKILAVCPPLTIPGGVSKGLVYKNCGADVTIKCFSCKFIDVIVRKRCSNGLVLDSSSSLPPHRPNWNLEYDVPIEVSLLDQKLERQDFIRKAKANRKRLQNEADEGFMSSEEEMEFEDDSKPRKEKVIDDASLEEEDANNCNATANEPIKTNVQDIDPATLLYEALSGITTEQTSEQPIITNSRINLSTTKELETFSEELHRMSDVAFLENALTGLPMLSGAMEGLGSQSVDGFFTDSVPSDPTIEKLSKDSYQRPGFENLCLGTLAKDEFFYGNADTYMVRPSRQRERALLIKSQLHSRGIGAVENLCGGADDKEEQDSNDEEAEAFESKMVVSRNKSAEDDTLLPSQPVSTRLLISSLLGKDLLNESCTSYRANIGQAPWLELRMHEMSTKAVEAMSNILAPDNPYSEPDW